MMKRFSVYLRVTEEQTQATHTYVTAPSAVAAIQAQMRVQNVRFVHHALAFIAGDGLGESATLMHYVYVPPVPVRKAVR